MTRADGARPIVEIGLSGAAALWFVGIPLGIAALLAVAPGARDDPLHQCAILLTSGGLQLGGLLVLLALAQLSSSKLRALWITHALALVAGWLVIRGLIRILLADSPLLASGTELLAGVSYLLGLGGRLAGKAQMGNLLAGWRHIGLSRSGALGWSLAAAALVLWPWFLVGSLGDARTSALLLFQSAVGGTLTEWLWRGLLLGVLLSATGRRWAAALLGALLYTGYELVSLAQGQSETGLWQALTSIALALLVTELWARAGKDQHGVWGAVVFHSLYLALPRLMLDPRAEKGLAQLVAEFAMPLLMILAALLLLLTRKLGPRVAPTMRPSRLRTGLVAACCWAGVLATYMTLGVPGFSNDGYLIIMKEQLNPQSVAPADLYTALVSTAERSQNGVRAELDRMGLTYRPYYLVNMIRVDDSIRGMDALAGRSDVAQVMLNPNVRRYPLDPTFPYTPPPAAVSEGLPPWGVDALEADKAWELGIRGQGIVVAGQDTGYDWQHPELKDGYRGWDGQTADHNRNWLDAWDHTTVPFDDDSHGTHTLGTVVGNTVGMAPDAQWIGCRNMRNGLGNPGSYVECMEFFFAPYPLDGNPFYDGDPSLAPDLVNNSWGCPPEEGCVDPEPIHTAVSVLRAAGIMMVVSAGNEGPTCGTVWLPASDDAVLAVGAADESGQIVFFSSRGPAPDGLVKPDIVAPGVNILSAVPGGGYGLADGTSMAGPHVAGLVALLWSADPVLRGDIDATETLLFRAAAPSTAGILCPGPVCACGQSQPDLVPNNVYGYGQVDALTLVQQILSTNP